MRILPARSVAIAAYGITPFDTAHDAIESQLLGSVRAMFGSNPQLDRNMIDAVIVSTNSNSKYLSAILSEMSGIRPRIAHSVESLCNSGTNSIVSAYAYVASGLADTVLVSGADIHGGPGRILEWDVSRGEYGHPIFWASLFTKSYKRRCNVSREDVSLAAVKNRRQAQKNPNALAGINSCTLSDVLGSRSLTDDLGLLDCSQVCTGSASVLVASEEAASQLTDRPIKISGIGQKTVSARFAKGDTPHLAESTRIAGGDAMRMAGVGVHDLDVVELHDAFSVFEPMMLESLGLAAGRGGGVRMVRQLYDTCDQHINPRGGLLGSGHPLGATGVAQTIEIVQQLRDEAGPRQVGDARTGMVHNISAAATSSSVLVLQGPGGSGR